MKKRKSDTEDSMQTVQKQCVPQQFEVEKIMVSEVVTITPENTLYEAARIMGEKRIGSLIVMKYRTPVGIITERDLLREVVDKEIALEKDWLAGGASIQEEKVEQIMSYPLISVSPKFSIKEAAQMMIEKRIRRLGVTEDGKLVGIVTSADLIRCLPETPESMQAWFEVDYFMSRGVITADEETSVEGVAKIMGEKGIGSVIVTSHGEPIGIFTERDLLTKFLARDRSLKIEVGKVCSSPLITAPLGISIHDAAAIMTSKRIKRLPITKEGKLVGILSARDLVEAYARAK
ncbi:MAG TPA: CBS domain-containing protein [Candidatus Bathyarchaeota archaeon]|nr:CBS domain-containing protein [Candidatus Bathyarchaeota archaeon]